MEITKKARFVTKYYGGAPYLPGDELVKTWLESQQDRLLNPRYRALKDALGNEKKLEEILSVFNTNGDQEPIVGNWMLKRCSMNAAKQAGTWSKYQVSQDYWRDSVRFSPEHCTLFRGKKIITEAESVDVYTVSLKDGRSFFKAYQSISPEAIFRFTIVFPDDLCLKKEGRGKDAKMVADIKRTKSCVNDVLDKMSMIGVGAYRERFGKFEYV
jgi:hypothetical protein